MGVRLKSFSKEGVNTALQMLDKLEQKIQTFEASQLSGNSVLSAELTAEINVIKQRLQDFVPDTRSVNTLPLAGDITVTAPLIPYDNDINVYDKIRLLAMPITIGSSVPTYADLIARFPSGEPGQGVIVLEDENHRGDQWLYTWNNDGTGVFKWNATAPFGVNLSRYYTKDEVYNKTEIARSQSDQTEALQQSIRLGDESAVSVANSYTMNEINGVRNSLNNVITQAINNQKSYFDNKLSAETEKLAAKSTTVNGYTLDKDVIVKAMDIPTSDDRTVQNILDAFTSILNIQGAVENEADLPVGLVNGTGYVVRNGTNYPAGPDGRYPELFVVINRQWQYICRLLVNLDLYYTKDEINNKIQQETDRATLAENTLDAAITSETNRAASREDNLELRIADEETRASAAKSQLSANIGAGDVNTLSQAENYTDGKVDQFYGTLNAKVDKSWTYGNDFTPIVTDLSIIQSEDSVSLSLEKANFNNDQSEKTITLPVVSDTQAGIMTPADHKQIEQNTRDIENLHASGVFIGQTFNTYADLMAFTVPDYVSVNDFTYVLDDETRTDQSGNHPTTKYIWTNDGATYYRWVFAFVVNYDPTPEFANDQSGLIQGQATDGYIESAGNGFGKVNGWTGLKNRVGSNETAIENISTEIYGSAELAGLKEGKVDKLNGTWPETGGQGYRPTVNQQGQVISFRSGQIPANDVANFTVSKITDFDAQVNAKLNKLRIMVS